MRRYLVAHLSVVLAYMGLLMVFGLFGGIDLTSSGYWIGVGQLFAGVLVGVYILFLDRIAYTYSYPGEQLSQHFVWLWRQKRRREALALLDHRRSEQQKLTFRSGLFRGVWGLLGGPVWCIFLGCSWPWGFTKILVVGVRFLGVGA